MLYTSLYYYVMIGALLIVYYILPKRIRWIALLAGSAFFYYQVFGTVAQLAIFLSSILGSFLAGLIIQRFRSLEKPGLKRFLLLLLVFLSAAPLLVKKVGEFLCDSSLLMQGESWIVPVGISFYTLQMIAYLVDIYKGKIDAQKNPLKFALFISFFPQLIQGPIPRYKQLGKQLFEGHALKFENLQAGFQQIVWGFFLKLMIADKAAILVNTVFDHYQGYTGVYVLLAGVLYSLQLYADFMACTVLAKGVSRMFGIRIADNFQRPYLSTSIKDFWRRWHMSLSFWLRDYVYIPLGGNRRGRLMKWLFLLITFAVSGFWHGDGWKFLVWGLLHAVFQIIGEIVHLVCEKTGLSRRIQKDSVTNRAVRRVWTFLLVMTGWIIFRAETLEAGLLMLKNMVTAFNPWVLFDDSLFQLGLSWKECILLLASLLLLWFISSKQEKGIGIRAWITKRRFFVRWAILFVAIWGIWIFGTYGSGFDAASFIYGGF